MRAEKKSTGKTSIAEELKTRPRRMNGKPRKIGVMNPYVLADLLTTQGKSKSRSSHHRNLDNIDLHDNEVLKKLNAHFRKNEQVTTYLAFKQLFDPKISPLYKPLKGVAVVYKERGEKLAVRTRKRIPVQVGSGRPNPDVIPAPNKYQLPPGTVYVNEPRGGKSQVFGDVIQGAAINCYLHAALHSSVWVNWTTFPQSLAGIAFNGRTIKVNATFLLDVNNKPVGAQISPNNEHWGCAWEKAYAEFKGLPRSSFSTNPATSPPYDPNVLAFPQGDPLQSLSEITNLPYDFSSDTFGVPSAYDIPPFTGSVYDTLNNDNYGSSAGTSMITANPTVAWTKGNCASYGPKGAIVPSHAYSILGTFRSGTTKYIILRNPWGISFSPAGYASICQAGAYNPGLDQGINLATAPRGIFGLIDTAFKTYFAGFGWVQEPPE